MTRMIKGRLHLSLGAAVVALTAVPASAQTARNDALPEDIVVTASKRSEPLQQVPSAVSAVSGEALEQAGAGRLNEILSSTPGATLKPTGYPGRNSLVLRGISSGSSQAGSTRS